APLADGQPASGAWETPVSPACSPPEEGQQSFVRETHQDQLPNRARGTNTPRSRLAGSTLQYAPDRLHFHPLPCLAQTSCFPTRESAIGWTRSAGGSRVWEPSCGTQYLGSPGPGSPRHRISARWLGLSIWTR